MPPSRRRGYHHMPHLLVISCTLLSQGRNVLDMVVSFVQVFIVPNPINLSHTSSMLATHNDPRLIASKTVILLIILIKGYNTCASHHLASHDRATSGGSHYILVSSPIMRVPRQTHDICMLVFFQDSRLAQGPWWCESLISAPGCVKARFRKG
jgi:hypothetical protein